MPPAGLILAPSLEPLPPKLVHKIISGQFVDMKKFLLDNMVVQQQEEAFHGTLSDNLLPPHLKTQLREIPSPTSWAICFLTYAAVRTQNMATQHQLAYARLILPEALRHGGNGWLEYNRTFRKQAAINPAIAWNALEPALHSSVILGQRSSAGTFCTLCKGTDHAPAHCTLAPLQLPMQTQSTQFKQRPTPVRRPESLLHICVSWNKGYCTYPGMCTYKHICATCQEAHKARDCVLTPEDSEYKRAGRLPHRLKPPVVTSTG